MIKIDNNILMLDLSSHSSVICRAEILLFNYFNLVFRMRVFICRLYFNQGCNLAAQRDSHRFFFLDMLTVGCSGEKTRYNIII